MQVRKYSDRIFGPFSKQLRRMRYTRRARLYCVGTAKSGTHSIDSMFDHTVRSGHEPDVTKTLHKIFDITAGKICHQDLKKFVRARDKRTCLDVDSSQLNFFLLDMLLEEFNDALFLLTIRDCYSWLDSFINDSLRRNTSKEWIKLREIRFKAGLFKHPPAERLLKEKGLYTLDGYLSYWSQHNQKVISTIPDKRLLVVRTNEISANVERIAKFAGLSTTAVRIEASHSFKNLNKFRILGELDVGYLEEKVEKFCRPIMNKFFPNIKSINDSGVL